MTEKVVDGGVVPAVGKPLWTEIPFYGWTWEARAAATEWVTTLLWILLIASLAHDIYGTTAGIAVAAHEAQTGQPSWFTRFRANPFQTLKGSVTSETPVIDESRLFAGTLAQRDIDPAHISTIQDVQSLVATEIESLNKTGKLSADFPCDATMKSITEGWYKPDYPRCVYRDGLIFQAAVVAGPNGRPIPWLGIYRKEKGWTYYSYKGRALPTLVLPQHDIVDALMIPRELAAQFPELVSQAVGKKKEGK